MKRLYSTHILIWLVVLLIGVPAAQASTNRLLFTPPEAIVAAPGDTTIVYFALDSNVVGVQGYYVKFRFDETVLNLDTITFTSEWTGFANHFSSYKDTFRIENGDTIPYWDLGSFFLDGTTRDGYRPVARLRFSGKANGATFLYFDEIYAQDVNGQPINLDSAGIAQLFVCPLPPGYAFFGDFDHNHQIDVADLTFLIGFLFLNGPSPEPITLIGDADCSGGVDVGDLTRIIDFLFLSNDPICNPCP